MLRKAIVILMIAVFVIGINGCIDSKNQNVETMLSDETKPTEIKLTEMENLQIFLEEDQTDQMDYDPNGQKGLNYLAGAKFVRALAENAIEYDISMGAIAARNTHGVGRMTIHSEPMNYAIIDGKFIVIDPRNDHIYRLDELRGNCGGYISIMPDAQMMANFGPRSRGIDIDLEGEYNEKQLAEEFKLT